jgi:hypothetical protein
MLHSAVLLVVLWGLWLPVRFHYLLDFPFAMDCNNLKLLVLLRFYLLDLLHLFLLEMATVYNCVSWSEFSSFQWTNCFGKY